MYDAEHLIRWQCRVCQASETRSIGEVGIRAVLHESGLPPYWRYVWPFGAICPAHRVRIDDSIELPANRNAEIKPT